MTGWANRFEGATIRFDEKALNGLDSGVLIDIQTKMENIVKRVADSGGINARTAFFAEIGDLTRAKLMQRVSIDAPVDFSPLVIDHEAKLGNIISSALNLAGEKGSARDIRTEFLVHDISNVVSARLEGIFGPQQGMAKSA